MGNAKQQMDSSLTRKQQLDLYSFMKLNRLLEEQMVRLFRQNKIVGGLYSSLGQEAISVGTAYALGPDDWMAPMIRNIGSLLVRGVKPREIFTMHMARFTSPTQGKDGTSHFGDLEIRHIVSPISMLGDLIPVMTGVAMAGRYLGHKCVAMTWIGDGGSSTGAFHEGMNLAASQRAALVCIIENNQWAYSTPVARQVPLRDFVDRARAYGITGLVVDGNDVVAVYETARRAVEECREGRGPVIIEAKTMRMRGHAQHDPAEYVPKEMFDYWKARDPLERYEKLLTADGVLDAATKAEIDARIERMLQEDAEFAESSPFPPPELAEQGVFCDGCHDIRPVWRRPTEEVMPPRSSVKPEWTVAGFGALEESAAPVSSPPPASRPSGDGTRRAAAQAGVKKSPPARKPARARRPSSRRGDLRTGGGGRR